MHLIPAKQAQEFSEGLAAVGFRADVGKQDIKWGYFDRYGKLVIAPQFYDFSGGARLNFSEGLAVITVSGKSGYMDKRGKIVINPQFRIANKFSEGLACVAVGEYPNIKFGFIDKTGHFVINPQFAAAGDIPHWGDSGGFSDGLVAVGVGNSNPNPIKESNDLKYGYIDRTGTFVINPQFDFANKFTEGLAKVRIGKGNDWKLGYINKDGKYVWEPTN
jgi:WG containing repeat